MFIDIVTLDKVRMDKNEVLLCFISIQIDFPFTHLESKKTC
jgi:hypothetical protein